MFKTITSALNPKSNPSSEEINKIPPYIFCRWLSGNPNTIFAANQLNLLYNIPIENQYNIIKVAFAGKIRYIPYPKNEKDDDKVIEVLSKHFNISLEKAKEYKTFISNEELQEIRDLYI